MRPFVIFVLFLLDNIVGDNIVRPLYSNRIIDILTKQIVGCPRSVRRWLIIHIQPQNVLPHVGQTCVGTPLARFVALWSGRFFCAYLLCIRRCKQSQ